MKKFTYARNTDSSIYNKLALCFPAQLLGASQGKGTKRVLEAPVFSAFKQLSFIFLVDLHCCSECACPEVQHLVVPWRPTTESTHPSRPSPLPTPSSPLFFFSKWQALPMPVQRLLWGDTVPFAQQEIGGQKMRSTVKWICIHRVVFGGSWFGPIQVFEPCFSKCT